jgi:hypothetical protein
MAMKLKMYILIKEDTPDDLVPVIAAHTSLATYLAWKDDERMKEWFEGIFYKVVCSVNQKEFDNAKAFEKRVIITESALGGREVAIGVCPTDAEKPFKYYKLWKAGTLSQKLLS